MSPNNIFKALIIYELTIRDEHLGVYRYEYLDVYMVLTPITDVYTNVLHLIVIPWARVVCLIYTPEARGPQARGLRVYISGEPRVHMV